MGNKSLAEMIIFNSIVQACVKNNGYSGLENKLTIELPAAYVIEKFFDDSDVTDFSYVISAFKKAPESFVYKYAGLDINSFDAEKQKAWFKDYIQKANKFTVYTLGNIKSKIQMNNRLKASLAGEFLDDINAVESVNADSAKEDNAVDEKLFTCEEFQDLVFITYAETLHNPEIEDELCQVHGVSNAVFWNRFYTLYEKVFLKRFEENNLLNEGFFTNEDIEKRIKDYGFDVLSDALIDDKYPEYPSKYLPYFIPAPDKREDEEYIQFRKREYELYSELCTKYGITPLRSTMM